MGFDAQMGFVCSVSQLACLGNTLDIRQTICQTRIDFEEMNRKMKVQI